MTIDSWMALKAVSMLRKKLVLGLVVSTAVDMTELG